MKITCYLLHFERPISDKHTCQHYLGSCTNLTKRLAQHKAGKGARLCQVALERDIDFSVVRVWRNQSRKFEYKLKGLKNRPKLCPICNARKASVIKADVDFYGMLDDLRSGQQKPFVAMSDETLEAIQEEHVGEEFSRQPFLY